MNRLNFRVPENCANAWYAVYRLKQQFLLFAFSGQKYFDMQRFSQQSVGVDYEKRCQFIVYISCRRTKRKGVKYER